MKLKRSERLVDMVATLLHRPYTPFKLAYFTEKYKSAKSSISEDFTIIKEAMEYQGMGEIRTYPGASGGVEYVPLLSKELQIRYIEELAELVNDRSRILPGGYLYLTDLLGTPEVLKKLGKIIASQCVDLDVDYVMTIATKGIPIAQAVAYELNKPMIIARKDSKVSEGSAISVKYTSESASRLVQSMEIGRNSMEKGSNVILVDDFYRGGGTMSGMEALIDIFESQVVGKFVFCENIIDSQTDKNDILSIISIEGLDREQNGFEAKMGSIMDQS